MTYDINKFIRSTAKVEPCRKVTF